MGKKEEDKKRTLTVVPDAFIEDGEVNKVGIEKMTITYVQPADTDSDRDEEQFLEIEAMSVPCCDEGVLPYYYRIKTDRWSVDEPGQIGELVEDFIRRLSMTSELGCHEAKN